MIARLIEYASKAIDPYWNQVRNLTEQQLVDFINATGTSARRQFSGFWKDVGAYFPELAIDWQCELI